MAYDEANGQLVLFGGFAFGIIFPPLIQDTWTYSSPLPQGINWTGPTQTVYTYGAAPFPVSATASSGLPVSFNSGPSSVCSAGGTNGATITILGAGLCTVIASQAGNASYLPAAAPPTTFSISPAPLTVTPNDQTVPYLGTLPALTFSYSGFVNNDDPSALGGTLACSAGIYLNSSGQVLNDAGTYPIVCSVSGPSNYDIRPRQGTITVTNPVPATSSLSPAAVQAGSGNLTLTISGSNFVPHSTVSVTPSGGSATTLTPTSVSSDGTSLTVTVPFSLLASAGTLQIQVVNAAPGGGTSALQPLFVTAAASTVSAESVSTSGTATVGGAGSGTAGSVTLSASGGSGTVSVAQYSGNPGGTPRFSSSGAYFDAYVAPGSTYTSVQIVDCNLGGGSQAFWWSGTSWVLASNQSYNASTGCVTITVTSTSVPSLSQLGGTPFGIANVPPVVSVPSAQSVQYGSQASFTVSASDVEAADTLTLHASGLPSGLSFTDNGNGTGTVSGVVTAAVGPYTASFTANDGHSDSQAGTVQITVTPAPLTITADNKGPVQYSDPLPTLTYTYSGFVNGEGPSVLTGTTSCSTAAGTTVVNSPAGSYPITCSGQTAANYTITPKPGTLTVAAETAAIQYTGGTLAQLPSSGSASIPLSATVWDSAASGYPSWGAQDGDGLTSDTPGDVSNMYVQWEIWPAGGCLSGNPSSIVGPVKVTATSSGIGTASSSFSQNADGSFCVVAQVVGATQNSANPYYTANDAQVAGIAFYTNSGQFATGGGWINDAGSSTGKGTFGFTARYSSTGSPKGQMVYIWRGTYNGVAADFIVKSNALTTLSFTKNSASSYSATLQGKCSYSVVSEVDGSQLYGEGNDTFSATVTDGDNGLSQSSSLDSFALTVYQSGNTKLHPVATTALGGGNVAVHN
jgi:hypothetical protein